MPVNKPEPPPIPPEEIDRQEEERRRQELLVSLVGCLGLMVVVVIVAVEQEVPQSRKGPLRVEAGGGVKFHPIAGRDDDRLVGHA